MQGQTLSPGQAQQRWGLDLQWLQAAPPLIDEGYWQSHGANSAHIAMWPDATVATIPEDAGALQTQRLGHYFEALHNHWMTAQTGLVVYARNRPVVSPAPAGQTMGEIDCLFGFEGQCVHRELAVKYYLGAQDSCLAHHWVGPGRVDRLDIKLTRMVGHQLVLPTRARHQGAWPANLPFPTRHEAFVCGAFFRHIDHEQWPTWMAPNADRGFWCEGTRFAATATGLWAVTAKPWWLAPEHAGLQPTSTVAEVAQQVQAGGRPLMVAARDGNRWPNAPRGFVVPDEWNLA